MATKSMSYDHPAYLSPYVFSGLSAAGASGVTTKFAAFTAMKIKAVISGPVVAGTSASQPLLFSKSGTATSTTTLTALTSASTATIYDQLSTAVTLAQGDQFWYTHGTDATASNAVAFECVVTPGANVTA
jgi:hypothetical protein